MPLRKQLVLGIAIFVLLVAALMYIRSRPEKMTVREQPVGTGYLSHMEDLDGDGKKDAISLVVVQDTVEGDQTILNVNENATVVEGRNPQGSFHTIDLDTTDVRKEVVVEDLGPSGDPTAAFYGYTSGMLIRLGTTQGFVEDMTFDGEGGFTTVSRGQILDTWFYKDTYAFNGATITRVPQDFYARLSPQGVVTLLRKMSFVTSPENSKVSLTVAKGDVVTIVGCDDVKWCQVRNDDGETGWFSVHDFNVMDGINLPANEVFDGLSMAD